MKTTILPRSLTLLALLCVFYAFNVLAAQPTAAPAVTATKRDTLLVDHDGDNRADRGDTLQYTVVVRNMGSTDATGVAFSDTLDANTTLVSGSLQTTPLAYGRAVTTAEDTPVTITLTGNEFDGDTLTFTIASGAANGSLGAITPLSAVTARVTYTPGTNYNGGDSFTFRVTDDGGNVDTATVNITVTPVNDPPVAVADSYSTNEDTPLNSAPASVLDNDTDVDGDTLTAVLGAGPSHGTLTLNANGTFLYTPAPNFNGTDSFTYRANDGNALSNLATVTITVNPVNDPPVAVADSYSTNEDTPLNSAPASVLDNDTDVDGDSLTAVLGAGPGHGTLTLNANGTFLYTPAPNFNGTDSFTYRANDGNALSNLATVTITVNPVNDAPVANNDMYNTDEGTPLISDPDSVLDNDTDVENDDLTAVLESGPTTGTLTLNANGTFIYTPPPNFSGAVTFTYHANDGELDSNVATVTIMVNSVNDPPVANPDSFTTSEDTPLVSAPDSVLDNDTDPEDDELTAVLVGGPGNGTLNLNSDGTFVYTPDANFNGPDSFTYRANDGSLDSNVATVTITVTAVDDPPVAVDDTATVIEDAPATTINVLGNDTDIDGGPISINSVTQPANGTVVITGGGSNLTYQPDPNYCNDGSPTDNFTYTLAPGGDMATVRVTVTCVDDPPVAVDDDATVIEDAPATAINVLGNDTDIDGGPISIDSVTQPANGTVVITNGGADLTYQPVSDYCNDGDPTDDFTYTLAPGGDTATVRVTVTCVDDPPVAGAAITSQPQPSASEPAGLYSVETIDIAIGVLPAGKAVTLTFEVLIGESVPVSVLTISNQARVTGNNFAAVLSDDPDTTAANDPTVTIVDKPDIIFAYLPLTVTPGLPDLVVSDLVVSSSGVRLVVANQGTGPVTGPFWVDVYINPSPPPTAVNQVWTMLADEGLVWAVTGAVLPLKPGATLTLTIGDAYYHPSLSHFSGTLAARTPVYAQVDSALAGASHGAVLENHEQAGGAYNNIAGPVSLPTGVSIEIKLDQESDARAIELAPDRP